MVYAIFIILTLLCSIHYDRQDGWSGWKTACYRLLYLYLILLAGFSYGLGGDKWAYMGYFENYYIGLDAIVDCIVHEFNKIGFMPLWTLLNLIIKTTTDSFYVLQFTEAIVVNVLICEVIRRHTQHGFLFLLVYFLSFTFFRFNTEVMREGFALGLAMLAFEQWHNGRRVAFLVLSILAILFHISAAVLLFYPFMPRIQLDRRLVIIITLLSLGGWFFGTFILSSLAQIVGGGDGLAGKLFIYSKVQINFFGFLRSYLSMVQLPLLAIYFNRQVPTSEREKEWREKMTAFFCILGIAGCTLPAVGRLMNYVQPFVLMMYIELFYYLLTERRHFLLRLGTIVVAMLMNIWYDFTYWEHSNFYYYQFWMPYTSIVEDDSVILSREQAYEEANDYNEYD